MKYLFLILLVCTSANALTVEQAKSNIVTISAKNPKTLADIALFKESLAVVSTAWAKRP